MLSKIVQESVEKFDFEWYRDDVKRKLYEGKLDKNYFKLFIISSQISLLEVELERKKGMMKKILHCLRGSENACVSCESGFTNCEYAEQDRSYNQAIQEDITYLTEQVELIKKMV